MRAVRMVGGGVLYLTALYGVFLILGDVREMVLDAPQFTGATLFAAGAIGRIVPHLATTLLMVYLARWCWPKSTTPKGDVSST